MTPEFDHLSTAAKHLRVAIDGTILNASPYQDAAKFEVIAGRVERDGLMGRRCRRD